MSYGVTLTGFVPKSLDATLTSIQERLKGKFGASIDLSPQSNLMQFAAPFAEQVAELWQGLEGVYGSRFSDSSSGVSLINLAALTGTVQKPATFSVVTLTATGTPGTVLASGRVVSVTTQGTGAKFQTTASATLATVTAWVGSTSYALGDRVTKGSNVYQVSQEGTSGSGGPSGTGSGIVDGSVTWFFLGAGSGAVDVAARAQETGPTVAAAGVLTTVETPVAGWSGVTNVLDAEPGRNLETDAELRIRREQELPAQGNASTEAIRAKVLKVKNVTSCFVFENVTDTTDADGVEPHTIEVLVQGGADQEIREAIFAARAGGIRTHGSVTGTVTDSTGKIVTVNFNRPTTIPIYVKVHVEKTDKFPADGVDQIKAAIIAESLKLTIGSNVVVRAFNRILFPISGVYDVTTLEVGLTSTTFPTNITITTREVADFDTSRIAVTTSNASDT